MKSPIQRLVIEFRGTFMSFLPQISLVNRRINLFGVLCLDSQIAIYKYSVVVYPVLVYPFSGHTRVELRVRTTWLHSTYTLICRTICNIYLSPL